MKENAKKENNNYAFKISYFSRKLWIWKFMYNTEKNAS